MKNAMKKYSFSWLVIFVLSMSLSFHSSFLNAAPAAEEEPFYLNLEGVDIRVLIATVAKKTGKNFILDQRIKGKKVTVVSSKPVNAAELYDTFLAILEVHDLAAVPGKNVIKIVPDSIVKQRGIRTATSKKPGYGDEVVTRVVKINHVNSMQLVPILRPLIPQEGHMAAFPTSNVLIVSDRAENIKRILKLIRRIDQPNSDEVEVVPLQNASAVELVRILSALRKSPGKGKSGGAQSTLVADERTNSILIGGGSADRLKLRGLITHLDTPIEDGGNTQVIYLKYAEATALVPVLTSVSTSIGASGGKPKAGAAGASAGGGGGSLINIQADESTNSLVITAPPEIMRSLQVVIRQLDIRRAQVLVEAVIAEVSTTKSSELGIQFTDNLTGTGAGPIVSSQFPGTGANVLDIFTQVSPVNALGNGLNLAVGTGKRFGLLLRALASDNKTNVLSTPSIITLDNVEAEIVVGQNVPFVTGSQQTTGGLANPFQTIQRQDVGLTLKVKPQINEGDAIQLDIIQETSNISTDTVAGSSDIITNKRSIKTTVLADDGDIVVLGGLISDDLQEGETKVPVLGDIPIVGGLFRSQTVTKVKTNLMVFIHPVILRTAKSGSQYAGRKYNFIRAKQLEAKAEGVHLISDEEAPVLKPLDEFLELPPPFEETAEP